MKLFSNCTQVDNLAKLPVFEAARELVRVLNLDRIYIHHDGAYRESYIAEIEYKDQGEAKKAEITGKNVPNLVYKIIGYFGGIEQ